MPRRAASSRDTRIASPVSYIRGGEGGTGRRQAMVSGAKKEFWACVTRVEKAGKGRRRRGRSFAPIAGRGVIRDARDGWGIYRQRGGRADAKAPGDGFWSRNRVLVFLQDPQVLRDTRDESE